MNPSLHIHDRIGKSTSHRLPAFNHTSRVLLIAPHPDDESLGCGLMLQAAATAGATVSILYLTDGDNNVWAQRFIERRWRVSEDDRARWGKLRRAETLNALHALGLDASCAEFAGLPDQGLTDLLMCDANSLTTLIERAIVDLAPTHVFAPSLFDIHPDHSAAAVAVRLAKRNLAPRIAAPELWTFAVHGDHAAFAQGAATVSLGERERRKKLAAIEEHRSQLKLSGKRFREYARRPECFRDASEAGMPAQAFGRVTVNSPQHVAIHFPQRARGRWCLLLLAHDRARNPFGATISASLGGHVDLVRDRAESPLTAMMEGNGGKTTRLTILRDGLSARDPIYLKIDHRPIFFDRGGWIEIPAISGTQAQPMEATALPEAIAAA